MVQLDCAYQLFKNFDNKKLIDAINIGFSIKAIHFSKSLQLQFKPRAIMKLIVLFLAVVATALGAAIQVSCSKNLIFILK